MANNTLCNYSDNLTRVDAIDPKGIMDQLTIGWITEFSIEEEPETQEDLTFDGIVVTPSKYCKTSISLSRIVRYNVADEQKITNLINCMKTDPMILSFTSQKTASDYAKNPVGKHVESYKNCYLSSNKREFKPDEALKQELEFKSEGLIRNTSEDEWSFLSDST